MCIMALTSCRHLSELNCVRSSYLSPLPLRMRLTCSAGYRMLCGPFSCFEPSQELADHHAAQVAPASWSHHARHSFLVGPFISRRPATHSLFSLDCAAQFIRDVISVSSASRGDLNTPFPPPHPPAPEIDLSKSDQRTGLTHMIRNSQDNPEISAVHTILSGANKERRCALACNPHPCVHDSPAPRVRFRGIHLPDGLPTLPPLTPAFTTSGRRKPTSSTIASPTFPA